MNAAQKYLSTEVDLKNEQQIVQQLESIPNMTSLMAELLIAQTKSNSYFFGHPTTNGR